MCENKETHAHGLMLQCGHTGLRLCRGDVLFRVPLFSVTCLGPGSIWACVYHLFRDSENTYYAFGLKVRAGSYMPVFKELLVPRLGKCRGSANIQL